MVSLSQTLALLGAASFLVSGGVIARDADALDGAEPGDRSILQPAVDLVTAQVIALRQFPGATVGSVELARDNRGLVYQVWLDQGEVEVDAMTGDVLGAEWAR